MAEPVLTPTPKVTRQLPSVPYQAGVTNSIAIDRDGVLFETRLRLAFRVSNGATPPTGPRWMTLARLLRRVEMQLNGQDTFITLPGQHIASRAQYEYGVRQWGMDSSIVLTANAVTDYEIILPIPHYLPKAQRPDDAAVDLRRVQQCNLRITWGDASDLFTTPGTAVVSNVTCSVEGYYVTQIEPERMYFLRVLDVLDQPNTISNANLTIMQDRAQGTLYRSWHMATLRNDIAVQNIFTGNLRLYAGAMQYFSREPSQVLAESIRHAALPASEIPANERVYRFDLPHLGSNRSNIPAGDLLGDLFIAAGTTFTSGTELISISREALRLPRM